MNKQRVKAIFISATVTLMLGGCAVVPPQSGTNPSDPWETFNRQTHAFNGEMDRIFLRPVTQKYVDYVPDRVRQSVSNAFSNIGEPMNMINNWLQGKWSAGCVSGARFLINSTVGVLGLFDVASQMNLQEAPEDFGQTLGVWGVASGPYVVWPLLGPSSIRDTAGGAVDTLTSPMLYALHDQKEGWKFSYLGVKTIDWRAQMLPADALLNSALDPYVAVRDAYLSNRTNLIFDGNPPMMLLKDEFEDEDEAETRSVQ